MLGELDCRGRGQKFNFFLLWRVSRVGELGGPLDVTGGPLRGSGGATVGG